MLTRTITGVLFVAVLVASILLGKYSFVIFFTLLAACCLYEFYGMLSQTPDVRPLRWVGVSCAIVIGTLVSLYCLAIVPLNATWLFLPLIGLVFVLPLYQKRVHPFHDTVYTIGGLWYAAFPFFFFISIGFIKGVYNPYLPLGFLIILWANDTGAYLAGRSFGRRKLFERISPNKTWEGFLGGVILALFVSLNLEQYFGSLQKWQWVSIAVIISVFGTYGDLVESMLKRSLGLKDSGKILPGHGGFLDRFDGLLLAAPIVFVLLLFV